MVRTQIYLTDKQRAELGVIARNSGKKQSEIIREAIDRLIAQIGQNQKNIIKGSCRNLEKPR